MKLIDISSELDTLCHELKAQVNDFIRSDIEKIADPAELQLAAAYALNSGGKRFRPVLTLLVSKVLGLNINQIMPFAVAIEYIHTYSLIHDDLPCMDDDNYRRGKKALHCEFNEWIALLTGSFLQSRAYQLITQVEPSLLAIKLIQLCNQSLLEKGLIGGQILDLQSENKKLTDKQYLDMSYRKTGALFSACILGPLLFVEETISSEVKSNLETFAALFGQAYQLQDDLEDMVQDEADLEIASSNRVSQTDEKEVSIKLQGIIKELMDSLDKVPDAELLISFIQKVYSH